MEAEFLATAFSLEKDDDDDVDRTDVWGWPRLLAAISQSQFEVALLLLSKGANDTLTTPGGLTALHLACGASGLAESAASLELVEKLLALGNCSVNALDLQRKSPLFHAASCDNLASARLLLKAGALPNHGEGDSALLRAVTRDNKPMVELLLAAGARDDGAYRKALLMKGVCCALGPLMASPSRLSVAVPNAPDDVEMPDSSLLLPAPPDSECRIIWGSSHPPAARVNTLSEFYRLRVFEKTHTLLIGHGKDNELALAAISKWPDLTNKCLCVFVTRRLDYEYVHATLLDNMLTFVAERFPNFIWSISNDGPTTLNLKAHVLGIESKLSKRSLNMAVVFASKDQWKEADMFDTPMLPSHREAMEALGELTEIDETMDGRHTGGLPIGKQCYYASYCGFEIVMHVASLLSTDERRQFLGNDKVLLYISDEGTQKPLVPRFRGEVNSVAIVVQKRGNAWKMACFVRDRVKFAPRFPGKEMSLAELRNHLFAVAIDANAAVMRSPPYDAIVGRVVQDMLSSIWPAQTHNSKERPKSQAYSRSNTKK